MLSTKLCLSMIEDLSGHKRDRETVLLEAINARLSASYRSYCEELSSSLQYLKRRDTANVMKKINRIYK